MNLPMIQAWEKKHMKKVSTVFHPGDTVKVMVRVFEGDKERLQPFEGVVIRRQGAGLRETFTVRRLSFGVGIERTFPLGSPVLEKIIVKKRGRVRRAKRYDLRKAFSQEAKVKEIKETQVTAAPQTSSDPAPSPA